MPMTAGERLGPYEILAPIGAGGMGEVYRARDTRLGRDVAIKVSKEQFSERFEREARAVAALNHANICQLYDVGPNYLVMELIEGETLKGPLPLDAALDFARQIAEALEAAHEKGITHRDLKPANIKITSQGVAKVLDFGLASVAQAAASAPGDAANSPTLTISPTIAGMILGTAAYMPPEQARGKPVDKRADIWSFGCVFYEMLTGRQLFQGADVSEILASVIKDQPDLTALPAELRPVIEKCLRKDPRQRWRDIGDVRIALEEGPVTTAPASSERRRQSWLPWSIAAATTLALLVSAALLYRATRPTPLRPLVRLNVEMSVDKGSGISAGSVLALSPDGTRLVLRSRDPDDKLRLHTRLFSENQSKPLTGTENATSPFFSPDGAWIGFFAEGKLKKISVEGGAPVTLCNLIGSERGASWGDDRNIILPLNLSGGLFRVSSSGGAPAEVTKVSTGEVSHRWPQVLPGSQVVIFTASAQQGNFSDARVEAYSFKTGQRKTLQRGSIFARYLTTSQGTGHLVYLHDSTLFAVPFDPVRLELMGTPAPLFEDVSSTAQAGGLFAFSQNGTFVYVSGEAASAAWTISSLDSAGKTQPLQAQPAQYFTPRFSPDGKRLAYAISNGSSDDIWVKDLERDTASRLSFFPGENRRPVWTPDGKHIVFSSGNPAAPGLYWIRSDGSGEAQRLTEQPNAAPYSFSPDGGRLALYPGGNASPDIFTARVEGDPEHARLEKPELFVGTPAIEIFAAFSPDGRWLAYQSNESGIFEIYVRPFPGPGGRWQISTGGGVYPLWSRDGHELFFENLQFNVMVAGYSVGGDAFKPGKPRQWSALPLLFTSPYSNYDLAPDGKHVAAMLALDEAKLKITHLTFLLNFFDELRRRAPEAKK
ncbi:MAG TPA: protein kinase [Bryobacteraceae bacterium]|nr:protein kinase [Bryobacteraceae bacterium]